jgi:hypothetical protein
MFNTHVNYLHLNQNPFTMLEEGKKDFFKVGNSSLRCKGKIVLGEGYSNIYYSITMYTIPFMIFNYIKFSVLYNILTFKYFQPNIKNDTEWLIFLFLDILIYMLINLSIYYAGCSDPGIMEKKTVSYYILNSDKNRIISHVY